MNAYEAYMNELATQMRSELTEHDFNSLESADEVTDFMNNVSEDETTFVVINSKCGCAAGGARPGAVKDVEQDDKSLNIKELFSQVKIRKRLKQCVRLYNRLLLAHHIRGFREKN